MSLMDTIRGAREEAEQAGTLPSSNRKEAAKKEAEAEENKSSREGSGFARASAARAKPMREAAGSVHGEASKSKGKGKGSGEGGNDDLAYDAKQALLLQQPGYEMSRKVWWGLIIAGLACTIASWLIMRSLQGVENPDSQKAVLSGALMVLAYVLIIGDFLYDYFRIRPMRQRVEEEVKSMSVRQMRRVVDEAAARKEAKKNKKEAKA